MFADGPRPSTPAPRTLVAPNGRGGAIGRCLPGIVSSSLLHDVEQRLEGFGLNPANFPRELVIKALRGAECDPIEAVRRLLSDGIKPERDHFASAVDAYKQAKGRRPVSLNSSFCP